MRYHRPTATDVRGRRILVYDNDCGVCVWATQFIQRHSSQDIEILAFSELPESGLLTSLSQEEVLASAHYITPDGDEIHGGAAMTRVLRLLPLGWLFRLLDIPGLSSVRDLAYWAFAANRQLVSRLTGQAACRVRLPNEIEAEVPSGPTLPPSNSEK